MDRNIQLMMAALGAAIGAIVLGVVGACIGAIAGYLIAAAGINGLRRWTPGMSVLIDGGERREMEIAMHMALSVSWGLRPIILADDYVGKKVLEKVFDTIVEPYTMTVTPFVQDLQRHLRTVVQGGQKPEDSLRDVKRRYGRRRFSRKQSDVLPILAERILTIQGEWGSIVESRVWFERWCDEVGLNDQGECLWINFFGEDIQTMDEWKAARRKAEIESFFADDDPT